MGGSRRNNRCYFSGYKVALLLPETVAFGRRRGRLTHSRLHAHALEVLVRGVATEVLLLDLQGLIDVVKLLRAVRVGVVALAVSRQVCRLSIQEGAAAEFGGALMAIASAAALHEGSIDFGSRGALRVVTVV